MLDVMYIPLIAVGAFFVVLFVIGWPLSVAGGWRQLAWTYPSDGPVEGTTWRFQSMSFRWVGYNGGLNVTVNQQGMRVAFGFPWTWTPLNVTHPPLFLPWSDMSTTRGKVMWGLIEVVRIQMQRDPAVTINFEAKLARRIQDAVGGAWPEPVETPAAPA
jgi:hypothetical protein